MSPARSSESTGLVSEIGALLTGIGQLVMILFPFAIPLLVLTAAAAAVLVLPLVAVAFAAALVAGPFIGIRGLWRRFARRSMHSVKPSLSRPSSAIR